MQNPEEMMIESKNDSDVAGKRVSVIGAARSGIAVAQLLRDKGALVFVSDSGSQENLKDQIATLQSLGIGYEVGGHTNKALDGDFIVVSPGVPSTIPIIREVERRNVRVISELEVASWFCRAPIIAVTGTNGKTTTTTLIGRMLHDAKRKHVVAGNIGTAFSSIIKDADKTSIVVLEVSSFQLEHIETFRPAVSILLNITSDHLDRYEQNFEKYVDAKCAIFENQTTEDILIYNYDDRETRERVRRLASSHVHTLPFAVDRQFDEGSFVENGILVTVVGGTQSEIVEIDQISIRGVHNLYNSMAGTLAAIVMKVSTPSLRATLKNFKGVEHRLEFVRELDGVRYINDSKATNVDSVWYALQAYREPLILLLGGRDKGNDYSRLDEFVKNHVKAIVAIGESADKVVQSFSAMKKVVTAISMEEAVRMARGLASSGDIVLLSPACASFDWFKNYEHRGNVFKTIVQSL